VEGERGQAGSQGGSRGKRKGGRARSSGFIGLRVQGREVKKGRNGAATLWGGERGGERETEGSRRGEFALKQKGGRRDRTTPLPILWDTILPLIEKKKTESTLTVPLLRLGKGVEREREGKEKGNG